jgi:hypothetical protein
MVLSKGKGLSYNQKLGVWCGGGCGAMCKQKLGAWLGAKRKDKKQGVRSKDNKLNWIYLILHSFI